MEVTLYAICKNEEKNIEKFLNNSKKFSHTIVVDTGSTDNTVKILEENGIEVHEFLQDEFNFAKARNYALSLVETDWAFSLDFNEDVEEFFPDGLDVLEKEFTKFNHLRFDELESGEVKQSKEVHTRFHRTKSYYWKNAVHEIPFFVPTPNYPEETSVNTTIKITKKIENNLSKELFYLEICEREFNKDPKLWYYCWFIFLHYFKTKNYKVALEWGQNFLNASKSYANSFRIDIFTMCSSIFFEVGDFQKSATYAIHAVSEAMAMSPDELTKAFSHLFEISVKIKEPNLIVFASGFSPGTQKSLERYSAIQYLHKTSMENLKGFVQ